MVEYRERARTGVSVKVMVTGGTGYVGAHSVVALLDAGHQVRLLVRDPARIARTVGALGVTDPVEHVVGDMTDPQAVTRAVEGCDAVLHAAAVVSVSRRDAAEVLSLNPEGARVVVGTSVDHGLDPVVHVSSVAALFDPSQPILRADLPVGRASSAYGRSKAEAERYVRSLQDDGAPVVITYPGGVMGPPAGEIHGEAATGIISQARGGSFPVGEGGMSVIDARDLGRIHAAVMEPGRGPRRYLCGGHFLTVEQLAAICRELTGRRFPVVPVPGVALRTLGRVVDQMARMIPLDTIFTHEAMTFLTQAVPTDDSGVREELGVEYRPVEDTLHDAWLGLVRLGLVSPKHAGRLAAEA